MDSVQINFSFTEFLVARGEIFPSKFTRYEIIKDLHFKKNNVIIDLDIESIETIDQRFLTSLLLSIIFPISNLIRGVFGVE